MCTILLQTGDNPIAVNKHIIIIIIIIIWEYMLYKSKFVGFPS